MLDVSTKQQEDQCRRKKVSFGNITSKRSQIQETKTIVKTVILFCMKCEEKDDWRGEMGMV